MTAVDLSGGLDRSLEYALRDRPDVELLRDSVSLWAYDDAGRFGLPRVTLEHAGPNWHEKQLQVNVAFPDGRLLLGSGRGAALPAEDEHGRASIFAGGALEFRVVEPFERWRVSFDAPAVETTTQETIERRVDAGSTTRLAFEVDVSPVVPPWLTGSMSPEAGRALGASPGLFVGGAQSGRGEYDGAFRYEQLVRVEGTLRVGEEQWNWTGSGLRVRRTGRRDNTGLAGHVWQSAVFPSGRGFGYMWLLPHPYKEGFVFDRGRMLPARIVETSWLTGFIPAGEDVSFVLETELGRHEIEGETVYSVFIPDGDEFPTEGFFPLNWQQAGVKFTWDGEEAYGMMERSSRTEAMAG
jgi:hypothetical protein